MKYKKEIQPISGILETLRSELRVDENIELHSSVRDWQSIVGPRLSAHTKPLHIKNRILFVHAEGAVWQQEINFAKRSIITKVNDRLGRNHIKDIRFSR